METTKRGILVVDDDKDIRTSLKIGLEKQNYRVETAPDAQSAIERVHKTNGSFDFILMDQVLGPGMDGLQATEKILAEYRNLRIILLTQYGDGLSSRKTLDIGAYRYVFRPFDVKDIVSLIESSEALQDLETALNDLEDTDPFSLRNILENLGFGVSIIDRTYRILYMNRKQREISVQGCRRGGICWIEYNDSLQQKGPCVWCPVKDVFAAGEPSTKTTISFKEYKPHYYEVTASPIFDANGKVVAALERVTDVTQRHELEEATLQAAELDDRLEVVLERIRMLGYRHARLYVMSEDGDFLRGRAQLGGTKVPIDRIVLLWREDPYSVETFKSNRPQIFEGRPFGSGILEEELGRTDVNQWMDIPLRSGGNIVGKISIDNRVIEVPPPGQPKPAPMPMTETDFPELMKIAEYAANAIASERDFSAAMRESQQLRQLRRMDLKLAESLDAGERLQIIVDSCCQITGADSGHIRVAEGNDLVLKGGKGAYPKYAKKKVPKDDPDSGSAIVARTRGNHVVNNAQEDKHYRGFLDRISSADPRPTEDDLSELRAMSSFASFPIEYEGEVIAVLSMQSKQPDFFTEGVCNVVEELKYRTALEVGVQNPVRQMISKLDMLSEIQVRIQEVPELQKELFLILTGVTMKDGLEFNRAMLFLLDERNNILQGRFAEGTITGEEWKERLEALDSNDVRTIRDLEDRYDRNPGILFGTPLNQFVEGLSFPIRGENVLVNTLSKREGEVYEITEVSPNDAFLRELKSRKTDAREFVLVPLIAEDKAIGVIYADNKFTGANITPYTLHMLELFANQAAIAVRNTEIMEELRSTHTELKRAQESLIKEKLSAWEGVSARAAHRLGNQLSAVCNFLKAMDIRDSNRTDDGKRFGDLTEQMQNALNVGLDIVREFEIITTPPRLELKVYSLESILSASKAQMVGIDKACHIEIEPGVPKIECDSSRIQQVFVELIRNASHFKPESLEINIAARLVSTQEGKSMVEMEFYDNGPGIPEEDSERIFEPFFTTRDGGTGLGLCTIITLLQAHRGNITLADSPEGGGARFIIRLPIKQEEEVTDA